jgi:MEDS: MEthanogen/methylotroph, DcmR Sensory domain
MRNLGARFECLRMRPHDHIGWVFAGPDEFAALARPFLAEGRDRGEKLMCVAEDPASPAITALAEMAGPDGFEMTSITDVYGTDRVVDAVRQRGTFMAVLADARAHGYTGIRVAADNSSLVGDEKRLKAWIEWEIVADRFMAENPVTGLCAFDRDKIDVDRLRHLATLHPLSSVSSPVPQFRLFADAGDLCIEGDVDALAISQVGLALGVLPPHTPVLVDLATAVLRGGATLTALSDLASSGVDVTVQGQPAAISGLREAGLRGGGHLALREISLRS